MKVIMDLVDKIDEEIAGAKEYAEKYLELKSTDNVWTNKYKEMANDELKHANIIHDYAMAQIEQLRRVYTPPTHMQELWDKSHKEYVEKVAWIKQMLAM